MRTGGRGDILIGAHGQGKGEWRRWKRHAISLEEKAMFFQCEHGQTLESVVQKCVGFSIPGDSEHLTGHGPRQPA